MKENFCIVINIYLRLLVLADSSFFSVITGKNLDVSPITVLYRIYDRKYSQHLLMNGYSLRRKDQKIKPFLWTEAGRFILSMLQHWDEIFSFLLVNSPGIGAYG